VALTELHEGLVGRPLQSVVEVVTPGRGKPSRHGRVGGVSQNVHMDLAAPQPELTVRTATVRGKTRLAEAVQHISKQGRKPGAVQPVTMEPSVGSKGGRGSHPSVKNKGEMNQPFIHRTEPTNQNSKNKPRRQQNVNSDSVFSNANLAKLR
jgi:hypothetical protein